MTMITCPKCQAELPPPAVQNWAICSKCGARWELTDDHQQIKSKTLVVKPITHITGSKIGVSKNG